MKIDRLLGITMYLLNRKTVSASELAERFEVSVRTIQRDIDSLCCAGIPIFATQGASGGYGIMDTYTLNKQIINTDDFFFIVTALKSLCSAYENKKILHTLEKITSLFSKDSEVINENNTLYIDFTAFQESKYVKDNFSQIEKGIKDSKLLEFDYTSSTHEHSHRKVEPVTFVFKWHAWYLIAYCRTISEYRLFCISRIRNIKLLNTSFNKRSIDPEDFFNQMEKAPESLIKLRISFDVNIKIAMETYFGEGRFKKINENSYILDINLPKNEQYWLGTIMSFGNKIKILKPVRLKKLLLEKAKEITELYSST